MRRQPAFYRHDRGGISPSLCKGRWHAERAGRVVGADFDNPSVSKLTAPFTQGSRKNARQSAFYSHSCTSFHLPCVREGGTRSASEGLSATISNNPSVSKLTAPFTQGSRFSAEALCADNGGGNSLPSLCKGRWHAKCAGRVVHPQIQVITHKQSRSGENSPERLFRL